MTPAMIGDLSRRCGTSSHLDLNHRRSGTASTVRSPPKAWKPNLQDVASVVRSASDGSGQPAKVFPSVDAGGMAIGPDRLNAVPAHAIPPSENKRSVGIGPGGRPVGIPEDVLFPRTSGTGTKTPEVFQKEECFVAIGPTNGQFAVKRGDIQGLHTGRLVAEPSGSKSQGCC